jgi:CDP-diglyceride synthetase
LPGFAERQSGCGVLRQVRYEARRSMARSRAAVDWSDVPEAVVVHVCLCIALAFLQAWRAPEGREVPYLWFLLAWNLILILLYRSFLGGRRNWTRHTQVVLTFPVGLVLLMAAVGEYVGAQ